MNDIALGCALVLAMVLTIVTFDRATMTNAMMFLLTTQISVEMAVAEPEKSK